MIFSRIYNRMKQTPKLIVLPGLLLSVLFTSCFTGVESTPKIGTAEVKHKNAANRTAEQLYLADVKPQPLKDWVVGKRLLVANPKIALIFQSTGVHQAFNASDTLIYLGLRETQSPIGSATDILFGHNSWPDTLIYRVNEKPQSVLEREELEVPFTIDLLTIDEVRSRLAGNTYYVLTPRWYTGSDITTTRQKYVPVNIVAVEPGNEEFPVKVNFVPSTHNERKEVYSLYMTLGSNKHATRNFDTLFSLSNPRDRYPSITAENWENIINNRIAAGMTREEARLALGSPRDVDRGHDYSSVYERWSYDGGVYLIFRDGLLESFRR